MSVTQKEIPTKYLVFLIYFKLATRNFSSSSEKETEEVAVFNSWYVCIGNKNLGVRKWDPFKMHCSNTISERAAQHSTTKIKYQHTPKFALQLYKKEIALRSTEMCVTAHS